MLRYLMRQGLGMKPAGIQNRPANTMMLAQLRLKNALLVVIVKL
jgi:hypothetical protein